MKFLNDLECLHLADEPSFETGHPISVPLAPKLRVAAIDFLNPAPLMWDFEHEPVRARLAARYEVRYTRPSVCAADVLSGRADLGLIPVAALTAELAVVPGCAIASLGKVRSIQLILKTPHTFGTVRTVAADTASLSSVAYAQVLFRKFTGNDPVFVPAVADPVAMLGAADAALVIGDPALLALEARAEIERAVGPCVWLDVAEEWTQRTGLPWVAAVWAARPEAVADWDGLVRDLQASRDHGLAHIEELVREWTPRIALSPATIREYLGHNVHYTLDAACIEAITVFRRCATEVGALPAL